MTNNITILANRSFWLEYTEKNAEIAFKRAFANGFGIEKGLGEING
jgi:hypothetical protein